MRDAVRAAWPRFAERWEGRVRYMYLDTKRYVTCGIGRKIDDSSKISNYGLALPWRDQAGALVLESKIKLEWGRIKARTDLAPKGGRAFAPVAGLWLRDPEIDEALLDTSDGFWAVLAKALPQLQGWPADAQLALLDMAYHMGPNFLGSGWPNFTAAAKAADFARCAEHCQTANRSPRDAAHVRLFSNAAAVGFAGLSPDKLWGTDAQPLVADPAWPAPAPALVKLSAGKVAAVRPNAFCAEAWYVQRMLRQTGHYASKIDGLFGSWSRSAYGGWARDAGQPPTINAAVLGQLSRVTLRMPVT